MSQSDGLLQRMTLADLRRSAASLVAASKRHQGTGRIAAFGSVARGDDTARSDVDLLVEFAPQATLLDQSALELELTEMLGRPVDIMSFHAKGRAAVRARSQAVPLA